MSFAIGVTEDDSNLTKIKKAFLFATGGEGLSSKMSEHELNQQALFNIQHQADTLRQDRIKSWRAMAEEIRVSDDDSYSLNSAVDVAKAFLSWMKTHRDRFDSKQTLSLQKYWA